MTEHTLIHLATPEGLTPCGAGVHDVTVTARIFKATCLECLRTLAQAPQPDRDENEWPPACAAPSPADAGIAPYDCERAPGHRGDHYALRGSVIWDSDAAEADR